MRRQHVPQKIIDRPVEITFRWNDHLDADNHAVMGKFVVDALKGYLLKDDDRRYVRRVAHEFYEGSVIEIEITEMGIAKKENLT